MFVGAKDDPAKKNVSNKYVDFLKDDVSNDILKKCGITDDINKLKKDICDVYIKIQNAWSVNDIDKVRNLLSDELYNMYKMQIMTMINKNQRNIISDFSNIEVFINSVNLKKDSFFIKATLVVDCKAYMIDSVTNNVLRGNSNELSRFYYSLIFQKSRKEGIKNCPNCNAKIDNLSGRRVKCNYCGSIIHKKSTSIILIDKKKIN